MKHTYICRERLSPHSGGDQCALSSQPSTVVWQRVEVLGLRDCFSSSHLAVETRTSSEGKGVVGGATQLETGGLHATPSVIVMSANQL